MEQSFSSSFPCSFVHIQQIHTKMIYLGPDKLSPSPLSSSSFCAHIFLDVLSKSDNATYSAHHALLCTLYDSISELHSVSISIPIASVSSDHSNPDLLHFSPHHQSFSIPLFLSQPLLSIQIPDSYPILMQSLSHQIPFVVVLVVVVVDQCHQREHRVVAVQRVDCLLSSHHPLER